MGDIRVALIMGGGVSLGSFSGGALARVIEQLEYASLEGGRDITIDVFSGASAGAMTLAVAAYHMMLGSSTATIAGHLEDAWVKDISIDNLVPPDLAAHDAPSIFADSAIRSIADNAMKGGDGALADRHPLFKDGALVSFALTNLNGFPADASGQIFNQAHAGGASAFGAGSPFADAVQTTFHDDTMQFDLRRGPAVAPPYPRVLSPVATDPNCTAFMEAAIASGAFPAAFPPVRIERTEDEYGVWWPDALKGSPFSFDFVDGGFLRNEPLREAIHLAARQDAHGGDDFERWFILIDPHVSGTSESYALTHNHAQRLKGSYEDKRREVVHEAVPPTPLSRMLGVLGRLVGVATSQATFRDWLKAARVNSQLEWREELMAIISGLTPRDEAESKERVTALLQKIRRDKLERSLGKEATQEAIREINKNVEDEVNGRKQGPGSGSDFQVRLQLLIDTVANMHKKRKLNMIAITPASMPNGALHPLAGNFLHNFGGFFDPAFRKHDFKAGQYVADEVLSQAGGTMGLSFAPKQRPAQWQETASPLPRFARPEDRRFRGPNYRPD